MHAMWMAPAHYLMKVLLIIVQIPFLLTRLIPGSELLILSWGNVGRWTKGLTFVVVKVPGNRKLDQEVFSIFTEPKLEGMRRFFLSMIRSKQ